MKSGLLERALDMLEHALVIVDEAGSVHYRNRLATASLKSAASPLTVSAGILSARGASCRPSCMRRSEEHGEHAPGGEPRRLRREDPDGGFARRRSRVHRHDHQAKRRTRACEAASALGRRCTHARRIASCSSACSSRPRALRIPALTVRGEAALFSDAGRQSGCGSAPSPPRRR